MKIKTEIETSKFINEKYKERKGKVCEGRESEDPSSIPQFPNFQTLLFKPLFQCKD